MILNEDDLSFNPFIQHISFQSGQLGSIGGYGLFWNLIMSDRNIHRVQRKSARFLINSFDFRLKIQLLHSFSKELDLKSE